MTGKRILLVLIVVLAVVGVSAGLLLMAHGEGEQHSAGRLVRVTSSPDRAEICLQREGRTELCLQAYQADLVQRVASLQSGQCVEAHYERGLLLDVTASDECD